MESVHVAPATINDLSYIDSLQRKNAEELSFYPKAVFEREIPNFRILLARINNDPVGYLYHGAFGSVLKIHQACIQYDARGYLYGAELIANLKRLADAANTASITLRCGSDIAANGFWRAMGFYCQSVTPGGVRRRRDINEWRLDLQPQLFVSEVDASDKKQNASIWRRHKDGSKSQFLRGQGLKQYRAELLKREKEGQA